MILYTLNEQGRARAEDPEIIIQEAWHIGSRHQSSTTREYIGAVDLIDDLRAGRGDFDSADAFYRYWRSFHFNVSRQAARELDKARRMAEERG